MFAPRDSLRRPGQYVAEEVAGNPVFVAVERDGSLRGFHNVCPHRAGVIVWPGSGTAGNLVCRYHGWAFDWDGKLKAARDFGDEAGLCPDDRALAPISVACWRNLVFVHLGDRPPPFDEAIAPFDAECEAFGIELFDLCPARRAQPRVQLEDLRRQLPRGLPRVAAPPQPQPGARHVHLSRRRPARLVLHPSSRDGGGVAGGWGMAVPLPEPRRQRLRRWDERRTHRTGGSGADPGGLRLLRRFGRRCRDRADGRDVQRRARRGPGDL